MGEAERFRQFFATHGPSVIVTVAAIKGSTPREVGAAIAVSANATSGTIGGGQLEYIAIDHARALLAGRTGETRLDIALGPEIGQCCGGRVEIALERLDDRALADDFLQTWAARNAASLSQSLIFSQSFCFFQSFKKINLFGFPQSFRSFNFFAISRQFL